MAYSPLPLGVSALIRPAHASPIRIKWPHQHLCHTHRAVLELRLVQRDHLVHPTDPAGDRDLWWGRLGGSAPIWLKRLKMPLFDGMWVFFRTIDSKQTPLSLRKERCGRWVKAFGVPKWIERSSPLLLKSGAASGMSPLDTWTRPLSGPVPPLKPKGPMIPFPIKGENNRPPDPFLNTMPFFLIILGDEFGYRVYCGRAWL